MLFLSTCIIFLIIILLLLRKIKSMQVLFEDILMKEKNESDTKIQEIKNQAKKEIEEIRQNTAHEIEIIQKNADQKIQEYKEHIETRREILMKKDEKTLLIDSILSIEKNTDRITHIEEKIKSTSNDVFQTKILKSLKAILCEIDSIESQIKDIQWDTDDIKRHFDI